MITAGRAQARPDRSIRRHAALAQQPHPGKRSLFDSFLTSHFIRAPIATMDPTSIAGCALFNLHKEPSYLEPS